MTQIDEIKRSNRGTTIVNVTINDDPYVIGFLSDKPLSDESYRTAINDVIRRFWGKDSADLYEDLVRHLNQLHLEQPLYVMPDRDSERARIGRRIRALREELSLEAKDLASVTGIDPSNISRIEQGKYCAGIDIICKIANALGTRVDFVSENPSAITHLHSMYRRAWIVPYNDMDLEVGTCICAFGGCYLPQYNSFKIGDYVFLARRVGNSYYISSLFMVSEVQVRHDQVNPEQEQYWLNKDAQLRARQHDSYVYLRYQTPLVYQQRNIIETLVSFGYIKEVPETATPISDECFNFLMKNTSVLYGLSLHAEEEVKQTAKKRKLPHKFSGTHFLTESSSRLPGSTGPLFDAKTQMPGTPDPKPAYDDEEM